VRSSRHLTEGSPLEGSEACQPPLNIRLSLNRNVQPCANQFTTGVIANAMSKQNVNEGKDAWMMAAVRAEPSSFPLRCWLAF